MDFGDTRETYYENINEQEVRNGWTDILKCKVGNSWAIFSMVASTLNNLILVMFDNITS